ncbi:MAG: LysM peptidoglycan-binding domain-containing protein [Candidatus Promineifilaceae bacterium]|jgi:LysM repeat protein
MMSFRRMLPFLLLNILVSAAIILGILWWWEGRTPEVEPVAAVLTQESSAEVAQPVTENSTSVEESPTEEPGSVTVVESGGPQTHIVQTGDTLGQISLKYDIAVETIMDVNGIDNPNFLSVGQELIIPAKDASLPDSEEDEDAAETEVVSADGQRPTPIPTIAAVEGASELVIADVVSPGQTSLEAIQIVNNGSSEASMRNWKLTDQMGNTYTFGQLTLYGGGAGIYLHTGAGQDNATDLFWGREEALWKSGDRVVLYDDAGDVRAEFEIP